MSLLPPVTADRSVPAPLFRRLAAAGYDVLPLAGVLVMAEALATGLGRLLLGAEGYGQHAGLAGNPWNTSFVFLVCFAYYGGFWVHGGQTLGLRTWKLRVQLPGGGHIGWWHALLRFLAGLAWLVPGLGLYKALHAPVWMAIALSLACLIATLASRLPDRAAGTEMVRLLRDGRGG